VRDRTEIARRAIYIVAGLLCFAMAFMIIQSFKGQFAPDIGEVSVEPANEVKSGKSNSGSVSSESGEWVVYVTGAVRNPGIHTVRAGARVYEALDAAGGFTAKADKEAVNLAAKLEDGDHIRFPTSDEAEEAGGAPTSFKTAPGSGIMARASSGKVDLNRASFADFQNLPGIGPQMARDIISYREIKGRFSRAEELLLVRGIGAKRFDAIKDMVSVGR
jgi:competence protein ComEA